MINTDCKVEFKRELEARAARLEDFANEKLGEYGALEAGWRFRWVTDSKRRLGVCDYGRSFIGLSARAVAFVSEAKLRDTILHEVAHYLAFTRRGESGHGRAWKDYCRMVGAVPSATYSLSRAEVDALLGTVGDARYFMECVKCGLRSVYYRRPRRKIENLYCGACGVPEAKLELWDARSGELLESGVSVAA